MSVYTEKMFSCNIIRIVKYWKHPSVFQYRVGCIMRFWYSGIICSHENGHNGFVCIQRERLKYILLRKITWCIYCDLICFNFLKVYVNLIFEIIAFFQEGCENGCLWGELQVDHFRSFYIVWKFSNPQMLYKLRVNINHNLNFFFFALTKSFYFDLPFVMFLHYLLLNHLIIWSQNVLLLFRILEKDLRLILATKVSRFPHLLVTLASSFVKLRKYLCLLQWYWQDKDLWIPHKM